jgi:hypothetical protein
MDYLEVLRRNGWIADPTDKVRVHVIHHETCPAVKGRTCWCSPHLVMAADVAQGQDEDLDHDLPHREIASGE